MNAPSPDVTGAAAAVGDTWAGLVRDIPLSVHVGVIVVFGIGLVLWFAGRHLLKPGLVLAGLALGAFAGFVGATFLPPEWSLWWPVGVGAVVFGLIATASYRFVMAGLLALALGVAGPLGYFAVTEITGTYADAETAPLEGDDLVLPDVGEEGREGTGPTRRSVEETIDEAIDRGVERIDEMADDVLREAEEGRERVREEIEQAREGIEPGPEDEARADRVPAWRRRLDRAVRVIIRTGANNWQDAPLAQRTGMVTAALIGGGAGVLVGVLMPGLAAAVVTSLVGSFIFLPTGLWLSARFGLPAERLRPGSATMTLAVWLAVALVGFLVQTRVLGLKKKKDD